MGEIRDSVPSVEELKAIIERISAGKSAFRQELAQRPIEEKMAMLDALRDRALTLRESGLHPPCDPRDEPRWYRQPEK